jgi:Zn-dependent M28 family amino/carboxypeptidase
MRAGHRLWASAGPAVVLIIALTGACSNATPTASPATQAPSPAPTGTPTPLPTIGPVTTTPPPLTPPPSEHGPTVAPSAVETPTATATATATDITLDEATIGRHLDALQAIADANNGERAAGTTGYQASVDYVVDQLTDMGYGVTRDPFDFTAWRETAPITLTFRDQSWSSPGWVRAQLYSPAGDVTGTVESIGIAPDGSPTGINGCQPGDWSSFTPGNIALVFGGGCRRRDVLMLAQNAGAAALVSMYGWAENQVLQPTLVSPDGLTIPSVVVGTEPGEALMGAAQAGAEAHLEVPIEMSETSIENVIAELPGATDTIVMLGGHLDSVVGGPGMNDNGSGVATLLALAESVIAQGQPTTAIRFGFWGAEEFGDIGSQAYVAELPEPDKAFYRAYLNLDMVGSPNAGHYFYRDGFASPRSAELGTQVDAALDALGANGQPTDTGGASDHFAFEIAGIPTSGVFSGIDPLNGQEAQDFSGTAGQPADPCYHLLCDTRENVDMATAILLGSAIADVLEDLAY